MEATAHCLPSAVILQVLLVAVVNVVCQYNIGDGESKITFQTVCISVPELGSILAFEWPFI